MHDSVELSEAECQTLLRSGVVGPRRPVDPGGPHVIPITFSVVDDAIIVRISPYGLLGTCGRDSTPAFEVDDVDRQYHGSWSVVARGHRLSAEGHPVPSAASGAHR